MNHMLTIETNRYTGGYTGYCDCIDPDYEDGWNSYESFEGNTPDEVRDLFQDHVEEAAE